MYINRLELHEINMDLWFTIWEHLVGNTRTYRNQSVLGYQLAYTDLLAKLASRTYRMFVKNYSNQTNS